MPPDIPTVSDRQAASRVPAVGDTVTPNLEHSWVFVGTEFEPLMSAVRTGTITVVPWAVGHFGTGTVRVVWKSMSNQPLLPHRAAMWVHTDLIRPVSA